MNKIVTIVIPTYNMEKFLHQCLDSLLLTDDVLFEQTEVLIVNDGSKDRSLEIAKDYEKRYPSVFRAIDKPNANYGSCVNRGLKEARGKFIKVLDADDGFYPDAYRKYVSYLCNADADMILTGYNRVDSQQRILHKTLFDLPVSQNFGVKDINAQKGIEMHAVTYRTQMLRDMDYRQDEGISYTDAEWCFIPLLWVRSVSYLPVSLYRYLIGREGQTVEPQVRIKSLWMMRKVFDRISKYYVENQESLEEAQGLMFARLINMSSYIYRLSIPIVDNDNQKTLQEFDTNIKNTLPSLYVALDKKVLDKHLPVRYIHDWRINPSKHRFYWTAFSVLMKMKASYNRVKSSFRK